jgi:Tfp pilus assembly protein PilV
MGSAKTTFCPRRAGGFTLAEALLASAILAIGILSVTVPFASAARNERVDAQQTLGVALAQEMLEEVLSKPFAALDANNAAGPEAGETRSTFNSLDDYDGYDESAGNVCNVCGNPCTDPLAADLSRTVSVEYVRVPGQASTDPYTFVLIQVTIRQGSREVVRLSRLAYCLP